MQQDERVPPIDPPMITPVLDLLFLMAGGADECGGGGVRCSLTGGDAARCGGGAISWLDVTHT